jgi:hypothetical protein
MAWDWASILTLVLAILIALQPICKCWVRLRHC